MRKDKRSECTSTETQDSRPHHKARKIGIVSRDYNQTFQNGYRDFSAVLPGVLELLDKHGCDTVIFSLYGIVPRDSFGVYQCFCDLSNINMILLEEYKESSNQGSSDKVTRDPGRFIVYYRTGPTQSLDQSNWQEYSFEQIYGSLTDMSKDKMCQFVKNTIPERIIGNSCILLCGETNGVKYSRKDRVVHDTYQLRRAIPSDVNIILNPIHDRMTRFEMMLKRRFLSENKRWVISVWNKGKKFNDGKTRDGKKPPWTVCYDGKPLEDNSLLETRLENNLGVEVGIIDSNA